MAVALRKESVDRNFHVGNSATALPRSLSARRAWIEISALYCKECTLSMSLSARRAWIEIEIMANSIKSKSVALRKESVDRNALAHVVAWGEPESLSARRAWIEIACPLGPQAIYPSRSPQGERG